MASSMAGLPPTLRRKSGFLGSRRNPILHFARLCRSNWASVHQVTTRKHGYFLAGRYIFAYHWFGGQRF